MLDNNQYGWFPAAENSNWSCYYYPDGLPHVTPSMAINGSEGKWSSCSSSSSDEDNAGLGPPTAAKSRLRIKKKLKARDRDNEIDYILKRKSLQLCRQSSNGSTSCSDANANVNEALKHKPVLSRQNSSASIKPVLSRQNSSSSIKPVLSRQNSSSSMMDSYNSCPGGPSSLLPTTTPMQPSIQQRVVAQLSKSLRSNCDKILDMSVPFILDSCVLWNVAEAVNDLMSTQPDPEDTDYVHQLMFLADVLEQTPSLCITLSDINSIPGNLDLTLFRSLQMLELRKIPPHMVSGLNTIRINLKKLKCTRCLDSLSEIFSANTSAEILPPVGSPNNATLYPVSTLSMTLTSVWPELTEIDVSFNRIDLLDIKALELTPSVQILNLSRNRISSIDCGFSRVLTSLSVLNLNYNQLTAIPPVPPNLKVLHISNNYIATLNCPGVMENLKNLEVLDISQNMISDENQFESLRELSSLNNLIFVGNPVSYLENYRNKLCGNLHKNVLVKSFILDKKKLSNSEVRYGLEKFKGWRANPMIGPGGALLVGTPGGGSRLSDLRSLTQSYDSNSSSVRSACRKRAKIREVVLLDTENMDPSETRSESDESAADARSLSDRSMILETKTAIENLRGKYGNDNWLLRQAGCEVGRLLGIPDKVTKLAALSQSLPVSRDSTFYSACAIASLESVGLKASQSHSYEDSTSTIDNENENSDESIKQIDDSGEGVYQSCIDGGSIEVNSTDPEDDTDVCQFQSSLATHFRFFQSGQTRDLCILDNFLYEINPELKEEVLCKWDLKSLKSITEEKSNPDTESVEFHLSFDTLRKQLRERTFIMSKKDYELFNEMASPFLQVRTLQEFADGFQCVKCNAQFSKGMADVKIVEDQDGAPKEVHICPNLECRSDLLIPLEDIPLPNNETFNLADEFWGATPQRSSTPVSSGGLFRPNSLPVAGFFFGSAEKSTPVKTNNPNRLSNTNAGAKLKEAEKPAGQKAKSDSDIEVVSCDSSSCSIEVLAKNGDGASISSSDIEVEEAVEIPTLEFTLQRNVPMTESNSSGSCTESVCTTYERTPCPTLSISQQLSPNIISTSTCSTSTLTPSSTCSPSHSASGNQAAGITTPIRYDYDNFSKVDHRLQLFCELSVFKSQDEKLLALTKAMVITPGGACLSIVIFSSKKIYLYKIVGVESDKPDDWLQKSTCFPIGKLLRLEVLIGRQGVCMDFAGKPHAVIFRDSGRTSKFIEFFLCDICAEMDAPPLVQDCSQAQKTLMSPTNPISYFGILRYALCEAVGKTYPVSALTVTNEEIFLTADLGWLVNKGVTESVCRKHCRDLSTLRQVECLEIDSTFVKLVFELETHVFWDIYFETEEERGHFISSLRPLVSRDVPFICLSQPLEP